jgi:hypothetical protein
MFHVEQEKVKNEFEKRNTRDSGLSKRGYKF